MEMINFEEEDRKSDERSLTYTNNHIAIVEAMETLIRKNERLPTQLEIAQEAKLSRQTVSVHMREFKRMGMAAKELEEIEFMSSKAWSKIMEKSIDGDWKATRLLIQLKGLAMKERKELEKRQ